MIQKQRVEDITSTFGRSVSLHITHHLRKLRLKVVKRPQLLQKMTKRLQRVTP
jgi:hypothetical protein